MKQTEYTDCTFYFTQVQVSTMLASCKDDDNFLKKDFYDWYLKEKTFTQDKGLYVIDYENGIDGMICFYFELLNDDVIKFTVIDYKTREKWCAFTFNIYDNLEVKNISIKILYLHYKKINWRRTLGKGKLSANESNTTQSIQNHKNVKKDILTSKERAWLRNDVGNSKVSQGKALAKISEIKFTDLYIDMCKLNVYALLSLMYYSSRYKDSIKISHNKNETEQQIKVKGTYKYTGYVNINKPKYEYTLKKNAFDPKRNYERHIEAWKVRGHYRRNPNGDLIWIEPFVKGKGHIEDRVYGTTKESEMSIIPKIFVVENNVLCSTDDFSHKLKPEKEYSVNISVPKVEETHVAKEIKTHHPIKILFNKIINFFIG